MTKLEEIEARHAADIRYSMTDDGMSEGIGDKACSQCVSDRAYLLAEVKDATANLALAAELLRQEMKERDRLRAEVKRLSAPVTGDRLRDAISEWHEAELEAGNIVPDFWDECETSERLAAFLKGRMS